MYGALSSTLTTEWQCETHCHSPLSVPDALPLGLECSVSYVHHRVAVYGALSSTLTAEWQCEVHCHSFPSVPVALPLSPDRTDTVRSMPSGSEERAATRP